MSHRNAKNNAEIGLVGRMEEGTDNSHLPAYLPLVRHRKANWVIACRVGDLDVDIRVYNNESPSHLVDSKCRVVIHRSQRY